MDSTRNHAQELVSLVERLHLIEYDMHEAAKRIDVLRHHIGLEEIVSTQPWACSELK